MRNWKEEFLVENLESLIDYRGKTPEKSIEGILTLSAKSVKMGEIVYNQAYHISKETYKKFMTRGFPKKGDILMTTEAPLGCIAKLDRDDISVAQRLLTLRGKRDILSNDYLMYYLMSRRGQYELLSRASGSTVQGIKRSEFERVKILLPPYDEQTKIAKILSVLDDKITLLRQLNETMEGLAQLLFKRWFLEEANEDWEVYELNEITDIGIGRTPPRKDPQWFSISESDVKWISIKDMGKEGLFLFETSEYLTREAIKTFNIPVIPKDTVILSFKMTLGRINITSEEMLSNEAIAHFKFNPETPVTKEYLYLYLKDYRFESLGSTSSIVTSINSAMIKSIEIPIPDKTTMKRFQNITENIFNKIRINQEEIQTLIKLRDTLLPKLMSGEVRVKTDKL